MDMNSKPSASREKGLVPLRGRSMSDVPSLSSYTEFPADRPFINTHTHTHLPYNNRAVRVFPESNGAAILSALKNLQEKIRVLELERRDARLKNISTESPQTPADTHTNTDLLSQLSAAEARCSRLERQLELMRRTVRDAESDRTAVLRQQASLGAGDLRRLEVLEQEYRRLTETQSAAERKIRRLEGKLQEEQRQRRLVQDTAAQLQTGLEVNRLLIESVSPRPQKPSRIQQKKSSSSKHLSRPQPHYRLRLGDVPFVTGTSTGSSHSVRANVQRVLHLMKQHHPQLCNERVLGHSSSSSSSSSSCGEQLSELLRTLQDEFGRMSSEQQDLSRQIQRCSSDRLRRDLEREMEALLKRMEKKGEQMDQVRRHQTQVQRSRRADCPAEESVPVRARPGQRSRDSLRLLKDMRSLQTSLHSQS